MPFDPKSKESQGEAASPAHSAGTTGPKKTAAAASKEAGVAAPPKRTTRAAAPKTDKPAAKTTKSSPAKKTPAKKAAAPKTTYKKGEGVTSSKPAAKAGTAKKPAAKKAAGAAAKPAAKAGTAKKPAAKTAAPKAPAQPPVEAVQRAAAFQAAAQAAREQAQQKRERAGTSHKVEGPTGSIYANAVREGHAQVPEEPAPAPQKPVAAPGGEAPTPYEGPAGSIYAAALRDGIIAEDLDGELPQETAPAPEEIPADETEALPEDTGEAEEEDTFFEEGETAPGDTAILPRTPRPQFGQKPAGGQKPKKKKQKPIKIRRESALVRVLLSSPPMRAIGGMLYLLGFYAECRIIQIARIVRDVTYFIWQLLAWALGGVFRAIGRVIKGFFRDLGAPFVRMGQGVGKLSGVMQQARREGENPVRAASSYVTTGVRKHGYLVRNLTGLIAPLAAAVVLAFVVLNMLSARYALAVEWQGEVIGHITDQTVLDDAKAMLRGRIRLDKGQNMEDWTFNPSLTMARTTGFTSKDQLVNAILRNTSEDIVEATGLYIDGDLVAVTTEGDQLAEFLGGLLDAHATPGEEIAPEFVEPVECDPEKDEVFLTDSVQDYDELVEMLSSTVSEEKHYTSQEGDTLGDIAHNNGLRLEVLAARNPQFEGEEADYEPEPGTDFLIQRAKPYLEVQTTQRIESEEVVPFREIRQETEEIAVSIERALEPGVDGLQRVWDDYIYVEGELDDIQRVDELTEVLVEPVDQITLVGIQDFKELRGDYQKAYMWPVPGYTYSSRGGGPGMGHRGRDINAAQGTPIFAANAGTVITAGWHYSYGNHVVIQHPDGLVTLYGHCHTLVVEAGQEVQQGEIIGTVGNTGFSFGNHLHLEFQTSGGQLLQPDDYVAPPHGYGRG